MKRSFYEKYNYLSEINKVKYFKYMYIIHVYEAVIECEKDIIHKNKNIIKTRFTIQYAKTLKMK